MIDSSAVVDRYWSCLPSSSVSCRALVLFSSAHNACVWTVGEPEESRKKTLTHTGKSGSTQKGPQSDSKSLPSSIHHATSLISN